MYVVTNLIANYVFTLHFATINTFEPVLHLLSLKTFTLHFATINT